MPVHYLWFLFDWRGRISRSAYRTAMLVLALFVAVLQLAPDKLHNILAGVLLGQLIVQAALDAKRLHDIGLSAIWVPATSIACIAGAVALASAAPEASAIMGRHVHDILGPSADKGGPLAIALAGLEAGALLRSSLLWVPQSKPAGDAYAYQPGMARLAGLDAADTGGLDAEALIARALAAQRAEARNPASATERARPRPAVPRKNFGMRRSA